MLQAHDRRQTGSSRLAVIRQVLAKPPQFGRLPLHAWVNPLRTQVKSTQARNGMCAACTGRAHLSHKPRFGEPFQSKLPETL